MEWTGLSTWYGRWPTEGQEAVALAGGRVVLGNPLGDVLGVGALLAGGGGGPVVVWSGWMGDETSSQTGEVEADFRNWGGGGRQRLDAAVGGWMRDMARAEKGASLWIRPHHRQVLSDGPSCGAFVRAHERLFASGRLGLLLDLDLLLSPEMAARREEHVARLLESAGAMGRGVAALAMGAREWEGEAGALAARVLGRETLRLVRREGVGGAA